MIKKVDERIRTLIENCVKAHHRSIVIIGDKSPDQIVNLHHMLSKSMVKSSPTVLCTQENGFILSMVASLIAICHKKKRAKQVKKLIQRGLPRRFPTNSR
ncbi:hypothetical protein OROGR_000754 [Orobanche gracilis]